MDDRLFEDPPQTKWVPPKTNGACGRDPAAGPGTCFHWWDSCPNANRRGCYLVWLRKQKALADVQLG